MRDFFAFFPLLYTMEKAPKLQTVLIPKTKFTKKEAMKWIKSHGYKTKFDGKSVDITENFYRFRQRRPKKGSRYYTISLPSGVELVYMRI